MDYLLDRLKERSTWLGVAGIVTAFGVAIEPDLQEAVVSTGIAVAGLIAVITKD